MRCNAPIGVFDSGVGGLTVVAALRRALPREALVYLGDTARVPYGTKSPSVVRRYAHNCARFLVTRGAKLVVVACNTASAHGVASLREELGVPVLGVIEPGAQAAAARSKTGRIGIIGTEGTIESGTYQAAIRALVPQATVIARACPLLVPLAEEGLTHHPATRLLAREYLEPLVAAGIDTLVLGCTHYPILTPVIREVVGADIDIIDSATATAAAVATLLSQHNSASAAKAQPDRFYATDVGHRFRRVGEAFLGEPLGELELVDL